MTFFFFLFLAGVAAAVPGHDPKVCDPAAENMPDRVCVHPQGPFLFWVFDVKN